MTRRSLLALLLGALLSGCATLGLGDVVQPPEFAAAPDRSAELRLLGPSLQNPIGGATVRIWTRVSNPNPIGLVLSALDGVLYLEGVQAAQARFPLGLPLPAVGDTIIPLDLTVSFTNLPALAEALPRAIGAGVVDYRLQGTATVDAGVLGQPSFGPMQLVQGRIQTR